MTTPIARRKVLVAMSGGIDSSMTALLLHEQGYEVIGMTMKTWDYASSGGSRKETGCCTLDAINDARIMAVKYGFPHYILDIRAEFGDYVIDNFVEEYLAGRTPNPCVLCNTHIKWEALLKRADQLGCRWIATGHYAQVRQENGRYVVSRGLDDNKDQSYVLWGLSQSSLARSIFPMGGYRKKDIRKMAVDKGFEELARKSESYEICFIPDNDYRGFLKRRVNGLEEKVDGGPLVTEQGEVVGRHKGYPFYTVGQRRGLEVATGKPLYVTRILPETNTVVLGGRDDLQRQIMEVSKFNPVKYAELPDGMETTVKIRYKDPGTPATVRRRGDDLYVEFHAAVHAVAPGQSAVFYEGDDLLGGGIIK